MATFASKDVELKGSAETVFDTLSKPGNLRNLLDRIPADQVPEDKREMLDQIEITEDSISFPAGPAGNLTLKVSKLERPTLIEMEGAGAPVRLALLLKIKPVGETTSEGRVEIEIDIPMMLRPMVSGPLQQLVDQFAQVLSSVPFGTAE